jgi:pSer/pThr/pTyr-binding forkhead associated (FHA) protein
MVDAPTRTSTHAALRVRAVTVRVVRGPDAERSIRLEQPSLVIGVGAGADFRLTDPAVSHEHLRLTLTPAGLRIRDEGSKNGTFMGRRASTISR